ncbi:MAG: calcium-binding EGF-like domain-containing protein [Saprospiraceae bacterium]
MNKKLIYLIALLGAMVAFVPACKDADPCKDVDCGANGTCVDGACFCNDGYEGSDCLTEWSGKFVHPNYDGTDVCTMPVGTFDYSMKISRVSESKILLEKIGGTVFDVDADVSYASASDETATKITIADVIGARTFAGTGTISGSVITGSYTITQGGAVTDACTFTWTKK